MAENTGSINDNFQRLFTDAKDFVKLQADYLKVVSVEKITVLVSSLLVILVSLIFSMGIVFYLFFTLAYFLAPFVGGLAVSFGIITLIYVLLLVLLLVFRKKLIFNPVLRLLFQLIYGDRETSQNASDEIEVITKNGN